jgi:hypothetical protein
VNSLFTTSSSGKTLSTCTLAQLRVLKEMAALPTSVLHGLKTWPSINGPFVAELDRRTEEEP